MGCRGECGRVRHSAVALTPTRRRAAGLPGRECREATGGYRGQLMDCELGGCRVAPARHDVGSTQLT